MTKESPKAAGCTSFVLFQMTMKVLSHFYKIKGLFRGELRYPYCTHCTRYTTCSVQMSHMISFITRSEDFLKIILGEGARSCASLLILSVRGLSK